MKISIIYDLLDPINNIIEIQNVKLCLTSFDIRGWKEIDSCLSNFLEKQQGKCNILFSSETSNLYKLVEINDSKEIKIDNKVANILIKDILTMINNQLNLCIPNNKDESSLRKLSEYLREKKVNIKIFLPYLINTNFYLFETNTQHRGVLGTFNITSVDTIKKLNLGVHELDVNSYANLEKIFETHWHNRWCIDISKKLSCLIDKSWAGKPLISPYYLYLKIVYHLSSEARKGIADFHIPKEFDQLLFPFQKAAVQIAARYVNKRGGVLIGDVVGLGKTLVATVLARIFEEDFGVSTLIICPKNLVTMWQNYADKYGLRAKILSLSKVIQELPSIPARFKFVLIDESHNLRNREGKKYKAIQEYISQNSCKCILLSATPYNKSYLDIASQLALFIPEDQNLGIRPEHCISSIGELEFVNQNQCQTNSLAAFEKSDHPEDWRNLMRLYMVRRTRKFIKDNYAKADENGKPYLNFSDGKRFYFPDRIPKTLKFSIGTPENDTYARLYSQQVVTMIADLQLPRYGLGNYIQIPYGVELSKEEQKIVNSLSHSGKQLMGFVKTALFKRLESCGYVFLLSIKRHIIRNYIYVYALNNGLQIPIGSQDANMLSTDLADNDFDSVTFNDDKDITILSKIDFDKYTGDIYKSYHDKYHNKFQWIKSIFFSQELKQNLEADIFILKNILKYADNWNSNQDQKLILLSKLITEKFPNQKILVFSQFSDTVHYITTNLKKKNITNVECATGQSSNPTDITYRFSPESNNQVNSNFPGEQIRVLVTTDILSEGHNLQDCSIIVNYDLPWAIIRLIQRAGRVDRIGQKSDKILCYSFLPTDGVENIINLRKRLSNRLRENAEVIGSEEVFFDDEQQHFILDNLYDENSTILEEDSDNEVDLVSEAYQIWKNAIDSNPSLENVIESLPNLAYSSRLPKKNESEGVYFLTKTQDDIYSLAFVNKNGNIVSQSPTTILKNIACSISTVALEHHEKHHNLVYKALINIQEINKNTGGQLGDVKGARARLYNRLKNLDPSLLSQKIHLITDLIYNYPLRNKTKIIISRQLNLNINDIKLVELLYKFYEVDDLCLNETDFKQQQLHLVCSLGAFNEHK